jgi:hypothetical protein
MLEVTLPRYAKRNPMRRTLVVGLCATALTFGARARADGTTNCTDASSQGQVERDAHKLVEARNQFILCAKKECPGVVRKDCTTWLEQVQASLPTVVPIAADETGNSLPTVKVSVDGKLLIDKIDGRAIEVNPGTYTFTFEAPDGTTVEKQVVVAEGEKDKRVTATVAKPVAVASAAPPPSSTTVHATSAPPASPPRTSFGPWKIVGIVTAGVGVAGLGLGSVFGLMASSHKSSAGCNSNSVCPDQNAVSMLRSAQSDGNLATVFFVAGAVLAAGGITMWALAPGSSVQVAPSIGTNTAGMVLRGTW